MTTKETFYHVKEETSFVKDTGNGNYGYTGSKDLLSVLTIKILC